MSAAAQRHQANLAITYLHSVSAAVSAGLTGNTKALERMDENFRDILHGI